MDTARVPIPLDTIRAAYSELGRLVHVDLRTQLGDSARLGERRRECLNLLHLVRQVSKFKADLKNSELNLVTAHKKYSTR